MLRTVSVTVAGLILSVLSAATATFLVLRHTDFGRLATGNFAGLADRWQVFANGELVLFFCIFLPTVLIVSIFVGSLTHRYPLQASAAAVLPISLVASGLRFRGAIISLALLFCAIVTAGLSHWLARRRRLKSDDIRDASRRQAERSTVV
jgi:hypothetical protein